MKKHSFFFPRNGLLIQILLILSLASFNYSAIADGDISEAEIMRVAKIAKATGTDITVIRVTTTVKVYGSNKKTNKQVKKRVLKFMKQKKTKYLGLKNAAPENRNFTGRPPVLEENRAGSVARAPALEEPRSISGAPVLDNEFY